MEDHDDTLTRRGFLAGSAVLTAAAALAACGGDGENGPGTRASDDGAATATTGGAPAEGTLPPTPACDDGDEPTPEQTEGPYFTPSSPERTSLREADVFGTPFLLAGRVLTPDCRPLAGALLDFWQADGNGEYDNEGYRLRGHQFTRGDGRYRLSTVVPGLYPGRTRHIHVKVQPRGGRVLTTQLYFPGVPQNAEDAIFDEALLLTVPRRGSGRFDFVLQV